MDTRELLGLLSIAIAIVTTALYVRAVLAGRARPHAFTWGIWALISAVVFAAQRGEGAGAGAWLQGWMILSCSGTMVLGLTHGDRGYTRADWVALGFALASVPLWLATGTPLWSVVLLCAIDGAGFAPTFRKSWVRPREEPPLPYILWGVGALVSVAAMEVHTLAAVLYPLFLAGINFAFVGMLFCRKNA